MMGSLRQLYWQQRMERREITAAAKIIQNAYRQYKRRAQTRQRQMEMEYRAAVVIQTYYRRYKQYCYSKKLHQAASLIQRQFRLYKMTKRKTQIHEGNVNSADSTSAEEPQSMMDALEEFLQNTAKAAHACIPEHKESFCCASTCSADDEYWDAKRHQAAMRIQQAFRGHRKRQAAAAGPASKKSRRSSAHSLFAGNSSSA